MGKRIGWGRGKRGGIREEREGREKERRITVGGGWLKEVENLISGLIFYRGKRKTRGREELKREKSRKKEKEGEIRREMRGTKGNGEIRNEGRRRGEIREEESGGRTRKRGGGPYILECKVAKWPGWDQIMLL